VNDKQFSDIGCESGHRSLICKPKFEWKKEDVIKKKKHMGGGMPRPRGGTT
jgi:hypothetical protein